MLNSFLGCCCLVRRQTTGEATQRAHVTGNSTAKVSPSKSEPTNRTVDVVVMAWVVGGSVVEELGRARGNSTGRELGEAEKNN